MLQQKLTDMLQAEQSSTGLLRYLYYLVDKGLTEFRKPLFRPVSGVVFLVAGIFMFCLSQPVLAQEQGRQLDFSQQFRLGDRFIRVAEPGELVDSVNVWGDVNSAGRYLVPQDTRLPELISYSFGPATIRDREANLDWSKLRLEVKVSRFDEKRRRVEVANFRYRYDEPEPVEMFEYDLRNNDIVTLQVKRKPAFIDYVRVIAPVISSVATGFLIVERLR